MAAVLAEEVVLKETERIDFQLYYNLNKRNLLVFNPNDETPICTRQLSD